MLLDSSQDRSRKNMNIKSKTNSNDSVVVGFSNTKKRNNSLVMLLKNTFINSNNKTK